MNMYVPLAKAFANGYYDQIGISDPQSVGTGR